MEKIQYTGETGCLVEGSWGQYAAARVVLIAAEYGWEEHTVSRIAHKHLDAMGPSKNPQPTDREFKILFDGEESAVDWLNENVAAEGYSFGWNDGEFFYMLDKWWEEDSY